MIDVSEPERDEVGDVPASHEVHDPLVAEGVRLGAAVVVFEGRKFRLTSQLLLQLKSVSS